mgnify:CR=1 FL=1
MERNYDLGMPDERYQQNEQFVKCKIVQEKNTLKKYSCIDMFAGAGGLSCGLGWAGFEILLGSDIEKVFGETFRLNHPKSAFIDYDIKKLSGTKIRHITGLGKGDLDLLAGGPPCQGFSINAPIRSLDDQRNHLFREYLRIAKALMPKAILIENVPGLVSLGQGTVVKAIYSELERMGYKTKHKILYAAHYGVPQMRFRTIFISTRIDSEITFPEPEYNSNGKANFTGSRDLCFDVLPLFALNLKKQTSVWDAISDLPEDPTENDDAPLDYRTSPQNEYQKLLRKGSRTIHNHTASNLSQINLTRLKYIPQGGSWRDIPFDILPEGLKRARRSDHTKRYGRLHPDGLCSTILTKCDPHWGSFFHPYKDRILSVREAARMQSFPDNYIFSGNRTEQYRQVGNAVPPLLARAVGKSIINMIKKGR